MATGSSDDAKNDYGSLSLPTMVASPSVPPEIPNNSETPETAPEEPVSKRESEPSPNTSDGPKKRVKKSKTKSSKTNETAPKEARFKTESQSLPSNTGGYVKKRPGQSSAAKPSKLSETAQKQGSSKMEYESQSSHVRVDSKRRSLRTSMTKPFRKEAKWTTEEEPPFSDPPAELIKKSAGPAADPELQRPTVEKSKRQSAKKKTIKKEPKCVTMRPSGKWVRFITRD